MMFNTLQGAEKYDKGRLVEKYSNELNSGLFIFPDTINNSLSTTYESKLRTSLFDTDGYIILQTKYNDADFNEEIQRLRNIVCKISWEGEIVSNKIEYDKDMYKYPAYIASDGYCYKYEYALIDKDNNRIVYIYLSFPEWCNLRKYKDFLMTDYRNYNLDDESTLNRFTIYAHKFEGLGGDYIEYSDNVAIPID